MRTRFVSLILGYALIEDLALWVVLAFATALAASGSVAQQRVAGAVSAHVLSTAIYTLIGLLVAPRVLKLVNGASWNVLYKASPVGYTMAVLMAYCAIAGIFDVNLQFAALLAGYSPNVAQADLGDKGTWYRLRIAGFSSKDVASALCDRLKADGGGCFLGK